MGMRVVRSYDIQRDVVNTILTHLTPTAGAVYYADELIAQKSQLVSYLQSKIKAGDWHAVQDAASDIRELDAKIEVVELIERAIIHRDPDAAPIGLEVHAD